MRKQIITEGNGAYLLSTYLTAHVKKPKATA